MLVVNGIQACKIRPVLAPQRKRHHRRDTQFEIVLLFYLFVTHKAVRAKKFAVIGEAVVISIVREGLGCLQFWREDPCEEEMQTTIKNMIYL